jgi:hypothetical protein
MENSSNNKKGRKGIKSPATSTSKGVRSIKRKRHDADRTDPCSSSNNTTTTRSKDEVGESSSSLLILKPEKAVASHETDNQESAPSCSLKPNNNNKGSTEQQQQHHRHNFTTNVLDHCETPHVAYEHLREFLNAIGAAMKIRPPITTNLRIWDPFYCDGSMKRIFSDMGFTNVIHENQDFYQLVQEKKIPPHDILITNPPYSDDHIHRLLDFVVKVQIPNQRPSCLLLPNWVSRQPDYAARFVSPITANNNNNNKSELFYLSPIEPYSYQMPSWVGGDRPDHVGESGKTTPYLSSWYLVVPAGSVSNSTSTSSFLERMDAVAKKQTPKRWVVAKTVKGLKWKINKLRGGEGKTKGGKKQKR